MLFPVAIFFIALFGGELFTGNSTMIIGVLAGRISLRRLLLNWLAVLVTNFAGAVFTVYVFGRLTNFFDTEPWRR